MRAALNEAEFSATALARSSSSTRSDTNACRAGASNAVTQPSNSAKPYTCHSCTTPVRVTSPRPSASRPAAPWVSISSLRRSMWSAAKPDNGNSSKGGPNCNAITVPTAVALCWVSTVSTSQSCPMRCIQVPTLDTSAPAAHSR